MSLIETVNQYAAWGWPVFPCNGKIPLIKGWPEAASTDVDQIASWWQDATQSNIGIVTGPRSGLLILDIDGPIGEASLVDLMERHGELPETLTAKTGKGFHFYLKYPADAIIRNDVGRRLGPGLDVRGIGGYVVAPGSRHANGSAYEWVDLETPIADPPGWLVRLLTQEIEERPSVAPARPLKESKSNRYTEAALAQACSLVSQAMAGTRNDTLNGQAYGIGQLIGANAIAYSEAEVRLMEAATLAGLPRREAQSTIRSGLNAGMHEPRDLSHLSAETKQSEPQPEALTTPSAMALQAFSAAELMGREFCRAALGDSEPSAGRAYYPSGPPENR
jgi:hypothetical protein